MVGIGSSDPGIGIDLPEGGMLSLTGEESRFPRRLGLMDDAVSFGPLAIGVADDTGRESDAIVGLEKLRWVPESDDATGSPGWLLAPAVGGPAVASETEQATARRGILAATAAIVGLGLAGTAAAQDDTNSTDEESDDGPDDLTIARARISRADAPFWIGVFDAIDKALPMDSDEVRIAVDGSKRAAISDPEFDRVGNGETISAGTTGDVEVYLKDAVSNRKRFMHWVMGVLGSDPINHLLPLPAPASELETGTAVPLTTNRAMVSAADDTDGSGAVVEVGGDGIPHAEESAGKDRGQYDTREIEGMKTLVHEPGENSPDAEHVRVRFRAGYFASAVDAAERSW